MNFTSIAELSGKKIAVDISIYLYNYNMSIEYRKIKINDEALQLL